MKKNHIKNLEINKEKMENFANSLLKTGIVVCSCFLSAVVISSIVAEVNEVNTMNKNKNKAIYSINDDNYLSTEKDSNYNSLYLEFQGNEYYAPEGYDLRIVDGKVVAYREDVISFDLTNFENKVVPVGFTIEGNKAVKRIVTYAEPIVISNSISL